jgi:MFS family permease
MIASTVQITAHSIGQVIAGKAVLGMGIGLYISFITSYVAELAPARLRGGACIGVNSFLQVGAWVGAGSALALTKRYPDVNDTNSFRIMFAFQYILMEELHTDSIDGGSEAIYRPGHVPG